MRIHFREATHFDAEEVRRIRNSCREFMTENQEEITPEQQEHWWRNRIKWGYSLWVIEDTNEIAGFCMIHDEHPNLTGTVALYAAYRGRGIGRAAYEFLASRRINVMLKILTSNVRSIRSAANAGFSIVGMHGLYTMMRFL